MTKLRYQEQFERVKRWYARFREINQGKPHTHPSDYYLDEVYAFFLNCYHLKDWIQNEDTIKPPKGKVEHFINQNKCMRVCADICHGIKHLKLQRSRSGENPKFGAKKFYLDLGTSPPTIKIKFSVVTTTGVIDAFDLASECIQKWEEFIKKNINLHLTNSH